MYSPQFGLKKKLFPLLPAGSEVFVSPWAAKFLSRFRHACAETDAIVTIGGPCGVGKTTLAKRALEQTGLRRRMVTIDGEPLKVGEVLPSLLTLFGTIDLPGSRAEQLADWQQLLTDLKADDLHVFVVIENALATGPEVISEIAALSRADGEASPGARMIIMGDDNLGELIRSSQPEEVRQRVALTCKVSPFCEAEVRGYLRHTLRVAGGDYDSIFEEDCAALMLKLSEGIPRAINALVEQVLSEATEKSLHPVTSRFAAEVAARSYDAAANHFEFASTVVESTAAEPATESRGSAANEPSQKSRVPDLDALARAIAAAHRDEDAATRTAAVSSLTERSVTVSETAREAAIHCGMDSAEEFGMGSGVETTTFSQSDGDLDEIARRLAAARTLDDVDDAMAETLFGAELNQIASIVSGRKIAVTAANQDALASSRGKRSANLD